MRITEEMLYEAAPEAAERLLAALPERESCGHVFSPGFEEKMRALPRGRRRRAWKRLVLLAAVVAALATAVYANQPEDYRVYAAARDGVFTYSARPQREAVPQQFHRITPGWIPEGYTLWGENTPEEGGVYSSAAYCTGDYHFLDLRQWMGQEYSATELGEIRWEEVTVHGCEGIYAEKEGLWRFLLWTEGPYVLRLKAEDNLDRETLFKIAEYLEW